MSASSSASSLAMIKLSRSEIIKVKPIGDGLNAFCDALESSCEDFRLSTSMDGFHRVDIEGNVHYAAADSF